MQSALARLRQEPVIVRSFIVGVAGLIAAFAPGFELDDNVLAVILGVLAVLTGIDARSKVTPTG